MSGINSLSSGEFRVRDVSNLFSDIFDRIEGLQKLPSIFGGTCVGETPIERGLVIWSE